MTRARFRPARALLGRHVLTMLTALISLAAVVVSAALSNPLLVVVVTVAGVVLTALVGIGATEREFRRREAARRQLDAQMAPVRKGALDQVATAAMALIRGWIVYRDVAAAQPRQAVTTILDLSRGASPEGNWNWQEADRIRQAIEALLDRYRSAIGAPVGELTLELRTHAHAVTAELENAADDLLHVAHDANKLLDAQLTGENLSRTELDAAVAQLRTRLQAVVAHAEALIYATATDADNTKG